MKDLVKEKDKTRAAVAQIMCWCIVVALHQNEGIGSERIERLANHVAALQVEVERTLKAGGRQRAIQAMEYEMHGICSTEVRLPKNRAPKNRAEQELYQTGNEAATLAWLLFALSVHRVLHFGAARLERLKAASLANYEQFNGWYREDKEWAFEKLRHCVQQALREPVQVIDEPDEEPPERLQRRITEGDVVEIARAIARKQENARRAENAKQPIAVLSNKELARRLTEAGIGESRT